LSNVTEIQNLKAQIENCLPLRDSAGLIIADFTGLPPLCALLPSIGFGFVQSMLIADK